MSKICVIIPIYNTEKYLDKCLSSVINQSLKDIEIIVINDGSPGNATEIVSSYLSDKRIKYFSRENHGIGKTRNFGIDKINSEFVFFLDSDDYLDEQALEKLYNLAIQKQLDLVVCDYYNCYFNDQKKVLFKLKDFPITNFNSNPNLIIDINLGPSNKLIKSSLFLDKEMRFLENHKYEDMALVVKLISKSKKIGKLNETLCYFNVRDNSETTTMDEKVFDIFYTLDIVLTYFKKENDNIKKWVDYLIIKELMIYNIRQRYQKNKKIRTKFIDDSFNYLEKNIPNYRQSTYYKDRSFFKSLIEKNKWITKLYCHIYRLIH